MNDPAPMPICPNSRLLPYADLSVNIDIIAESKRGLTGAFKTAERATMILSQMILLLPATRADLAMMEPTKVNNIISLCQPTYNDGKDTAVRR